MNTKVIFISPHDPIDPVPPIVSVKHLFDSGYVITRMWQFGQKGRIENSLTIGKFQVEKGDQKLKVYIRRSSDKQYLLRIKECNRVILELNVRSIEEATGKVSQTFDLRWPSSDYNCSG